MSPARWFRDAPLAVRLPLAAAAMIFLVAVVSTQIAIQSLSLQYERQVERMGQIYLDGLSAALLPHVRAGDTQGMTAVLRQALDFHEGIVDRSLMLLDLEGQVLARADLPDLEEVPLPRIEDWGERGVSHAPDDSNVWVWRRLPGEEGGPGIVLANLDTAAFAAERHSLRWSLVAFDLAFAALCTLAGFFLLRGLQRPMSLLAGHLRSAPSEGPEPLPAAVIPRHDSEARKLFEAFNAMALAARERAVMLARLAEQERRAVLGRLVATMAHEVRNPLAGVLTAVQTLRRFGDRPAARAEALDFMERGLVALREVVDAALETHRADSGRRHLLRSDLEDVRLLAAADAERRGIRLALEAALPAEVPVAATEVRQVLLNLLLNAVRASLPGGEVVLRARVEDGETLVLEVEDRAGGLPAPLADHLESRHEPTEGPGLGVAVIVRLVERLRGRVSVKADGKGTRIALRLPLLREDSP